VARELGVKFDIAPRPTQKEDSIQAARTIFRICWFDETNCDRGISALANYQKVYDDEQQIFRIRPVHNWASHGSDAFQTFALAHDFVQIQKGVGRREVVSSGYPF
jgi:hypothetical protein